VHLHVWFRPHYLQNSSSNSVSSSCFSCRIIVLFSLSLSRVSLYEIKLESFKPAAMGSLGNKRLDAHLNIKIRCHRIWSRTWNQFKGINKSYSYVRIKNSASNQADNHCSYERGKNGELVADFLHVVHDFRKVVTLRNTKLKHKKDRSKQGDQISTKYMKVR
jgi:hypothetical protein